MATIKRRVRVSFFIDVQAKTEKDFNDTLFDLQDRIVREHQIPMFVGIGNSSYGISGAKNKLADVTFALEGSNTYLKLK